MSAVEGAVPDGSVTTGGGWEEPGAWTRELGLAFAGACTRPLLFAWLGAWTRELELAWFGFCVSTPASTKAPRPRTSRARTTMSATIGRLLALADGNAACPACGRILDGWNEVG